MLDIAFSALGRADATGNSTKSKMAVIISSMKANVKMERIMALLHSRSTRNVYATTTISSLLSFASLEIQEIHLLVR